MATQESRPSFDRLFFIASAIVLIAIIGINAWTLWRRSAASQAPIDASAPAEAPAAPTAPATPGPAISEFIGPIPSATPVAPSRSAKRSAKVVQPTTPAAERPGPAAPPVEVPSAPEPAEARAAEPTAPESPPAPAKLFYTADDTDVIPPRATSPQLLAMLSKESPGVRQDVMMIAVIVNEQGTVDSVRAVNLPVTIGESVMLTAALSAVKSWHFRPAVKDGAPVKYRQVVPLRIRGGP